jgi:hypothetical protein
MKSIPVVIAKFLSFPDKEGLDIYDKFAYLIKSVDGDSYYFQELLPKEKLINEELGDALYDCITNGISYKDVFDWYREWNTES